MPIHTHTKRQRARILKKRERERKRDEREAKEDAKRGFDVPTEETEVAIRRPVTDEEVKKQKGKLSRRI